MDHSGFFCFHCDYSSTYPFGSEESILISLTTMTGHPVTLTHINFRLLIWHIFQPALNFRSFVTFRIISQKSEHFIQGDFYSTPFLPEWHVHIHECSRAVYILVNRNWEIWRLDNTSLQISLPQVRIRKNCLLVCLSGCQMSNTAMYTYSPAFVPLDSWPPDLHWHTDRGAARATREAVIV